MAQTPATYDVHPAASSSYEPLLPPDGDEQACSSFYDVLPPDRDEELLSSRTSTLPPPDMSEIRVVLLGNSRAEKAAAANFLLEVPVFSGEDSYLLPARGLLKDKEVVLINTPDLLQPNLSENTLTGLIEHCVSLCDPGPHVFLLVLQPEDFTEGHKDRLCRVMRRFSDQSFNHSLILISPPRKKASALREKFRLHPPLRDLIRRCRNRCLRRKNLEPSELFTRLVHMVKENDGQHVQCNTKTT